MKPALRRSSPALAALMSLVSLLSGYRTVRAEVPSDGLVACYRFEQGADDASGRENHGKGRGACAFSTDAVEGVASAEFDGLGARVVVPDSESLRISGDLTIAAWVNVRATSFANTPNILAKSFNNGYRLRFNANGTLRLMLGNGSPNPTHFTGTRPVNLTEWTHVAAVVEFDAGGVTVRFYVNGVADPAVRKAPLRGIETGDGSLVLGTRQDKASAVESLLGRLDQVTIHRRALAAREIAELATVKPAGGSFEPGD